MEMQQLKYFLESAENENFSHTALHNFVPPSAVSVSIKKLEKEIGFKLFDRSANKIRLNQNGIKFAAAVKQALFILNDTADSLRNNENGLNGEINMLIRTERSLITEKMSTFRRLYPNVSFKLTHTYTKTDYTDYDIIIDELSGRYNGYSQHPLISEKIKIAASKNHPLHNKQLILTDLKNNDFITMSKGSSLYNLTKQFCGSAGFEPHIVIESDDPFYIRRYISQNFGIAFYPETSWQFEKNDDIVFLDVTDFDFSRTTYVYMNSQHKSSAVTAFYNYLVK